jgi:hypothetical protein
VILTDSRENRVVVLDFATGSVRDIARTGDGPGEFRGVGGVLALAGDSSLVNDPRALRWVIYDREVQVRTMSVVRFSSAGQPVALCGADNAGNVCVLRPKKFRAPVQAIPVLGTMSDAESLSVIRVSLSNLDRADTVMDVRGRYLSVMRGAKGGMNYLFYNPLAVEDQVVLGRDGWFAYAASAPYHVWWIGPDGTTIRGKGLERPQLLDDTMKKHAQHEYDAPRERAGFQISDYLNWPMVLPAFHIDALQLTDDGKLVIQRTAAPGRTDRLYDVVDRAALFVERIAVEPTRRIVGFGKGTVYVVATDSDGLETLARHPWP